MANLNIHATHEYVQNELSKLNTSTNVIEGYEDELDTYGSLVNDGMTVYKIVKQSKDSTYSFVPYFVYTYTTYSWSTVGSMSTKSTSICQIKIVDGETYKRTCLIKSNNTNVLPLPGNESDTGSVTFDFTDWKKITNSSDIIANAYVGTKSGNNFIIDDISPLEHPINLQVDVPMKNLIPPFAEPLNGSIGYFEKNGVTYLSDHVFNSATFFNGTFTGGEDGLLNAHNAYGPTTFNLKGGNTYTFSCCENGTGEIVDNGYGPAFTFLIMTTDDETVLADTYIHGRDDGSNIVKFEVSEDTECQIKIKLCDGVTYDNVSISMQLELGSDATEIVNYIDPTDFTVWVENMSDNSLKDYTPNLDGSLTIPYIYPKMRIMFSDETMGIVTATYNKDITATLSTVGCIKELTGKEIPVNANESVKAEQGALVIGDIRDRTYDETNSDLPLTGNIATGPYSIAMGRLTEAKGYYSTALGSRSKAHGHYSLAAIDTSQALGTRSIAMGNQAVANNAASIAIGHSTKSFGSQAVALGSYPEAHGDNSVALGYTTYAYGQFSTAFGYKSITGNADGDQSVGKFAIAGGYNAKAIGNGSISIGGNTESSGSFSIALNNQTIASGDNQTVIGKFNISDSSKAFIIGGGPNEPGRKNIFSVDWNGEVNSLGNIYINGDKVALAKDVISLETLPSYPIASGTGNLSTRIGDINGTLSANGTAAVAFGANSTAQGNYSIAGGYASQALGVKSVALGSAVVAKTTGCVALGIDSQANASQSVAIGGGNIAQGASSVALGYKSTAKGKYQTVIGAYNNPDTTSLFIVGNGDATTLSNALTVDGKGNAAFAGTITSAGKEVALKEDLTNIGTSGISVTKEKIVIGTDYDATSNNNSLVFAVNSNPILQASSNGALIASRATTDEDDDLVLVTKGYLKTLIDSLINSIANGAY